MFDTEHIDWDDPAERGHPLLCGCVGWWLAGNQNPYWGMPKLRDLVRRNHGTLTNMAVGTASGWRSGRGRPGGFGCLQFDGSNDFVDIPSPTAATTNWAISAWVRPAALGQFSMLAYNGIDAGGWGLGMNVGNGSAGGNKLVVLFGAVAWIDTGYTFPAANSWYHILATRDTSTTRIYVNGAQTANTSASTPLAPASGKCSIGAQYNTSSTQYRHWNGLVDDCQMWSRHIAAREVAQLYSESRRGYPNLLRRAQGVAYSSPAAPASSALLLRLQTEGLFVGSGGCL